MRASRLPFLTHGSGWKTLDSAKHTDRFGVGSFSLKSGTVSLSKCGGYSQCKLVTTGTVYTQAEPHKRWYNSGHKTDTKVVR